MVSRNLKGQKRISFQMYLIQKSMVDVSGVLERPTGDGHLLMQHKKELSEAKLLISEQSTRLADQDERIKKLEEMFKNGACASEIEEKGSCSVNLHLRNEDKIKTEKSAPYYATFIDDDMQILSKDDFLQGKLVTLTLESNIVVAYGTIVHVNGGGNLLHGVPLPVNCMRIAIDEAVEKSAQLPFPIPNECDTIGDAVGSHVAWPVHLVLMRDEKHGKKKNVKKTSTVLASHVPKSLNMLHFFCKHALDEENNISINLDHDLFDEEYELLVHLEDIIPFYELEPVSANCIVVYIWHLYRKMKSDNKVEKYRFMNPHTIQFIPFVTNLDRNGKIEHFNERATVLADRLSGSSRNQLVLVPVNVGSLKLFNSNKERKGRKQAIWETVKGPRQPDAKQCGYYVMRFMKDIIKENVNSEKHSLSAIKDSVFFKLFLGIVMGSCLSSHSKLNLRAFFILTQFWLSGDWKSCRAWA
ncbi:uncharacterized protein [Henckelia pumila]|uniref:uncharacterized protein n=1 Tax=Henckelia pumila TaxID=405737 RepID=UPI003C6E78DA